jgi:hypothetical protein
MNVPELSDVPATATGMSPLLAYSLKIHDLSEMTDVLMCRGIRTVNSLKALGLWQLYRKLSGDLTVRISRLFGMYNGGGLVVPSPHKSNDILELPHPLSDDTCLMHSRRDALGKVRHIVGDDRYNEANKLLLESDDLAMASCLAAAQALSALGIRKEEVKDGGHKKLLKAAKLSLRDVLVMRSVGSALGLDSRNAVLRTLEHVCGHSGCDGDTLPQLSNAYRKICHELSSKLPLTTVQHQIDCAEASQREFRMMQIPPPPGLIIARQSEIALLDVDSESSLGISRASSCHRGKFQKNRRKKNKTLSALKSLQRMVKRLHDEVSSLKDRDVAEVLQPSNDFVTIYRSCHDDYANQLFVSPGDRVVITEWHSGGWAFGRKVNAAPGCEVEQGFFPYWCLNKHDNADNTTKI